VALSAKKLTTFLIATAIAASAGAAWQANRLRQIDNFNQAVKAGKTPLTDTQSFEAKFSAAYWLAKAGRYQDATLLFLQLQEKSTSDQQAPAQQAMVQYNMGNIFLLRGLAINGRDITVRDEAVYLVTQAKTAYMHALRLDSELWPARHNLDRVFGMLPDEATPGVSDQANPGLIMGNIPVGLP
jgi:tetratricopeptide (TPR) repeat protein